MHFEANQKFIFQLYVEETPKGWNTLVGKGLADSLPADITRGHDMQTLDTSMNKCNYDQKYKYK